MKSKEQILNKIEELENIHTQKEMEKQSFLGNDDFEEQLDYFEMEQDSLVEQWNNRYWTEHSDCYLALVEDDYELYNGYADLV